VHTSTFTLTVRRIECVVAPQSAAKKSCCRTDAVASTGSCILIQRKGRGSFFKLCPLPCHSICKREMRRRGPVGKFLDVVFRGTHIHCTTCLLRRWFYGKLDKRKYVKLEKNEPFFAMSMVSPMILPKHYRLKYVIYNDNGSWLKIYFKSRFFKVLFSLCEVVANW